MQPADCGISFSDIKDVIVAISALGGLLIAYSGLHTWRRQLKGNTEYELARRLLRAVYKTRDALRFVRSPFVSSAEAEQALREAGYTTEQIRQRSAREDDSAAVYIARWKTVSEVLSDLKIETLEAEILWGSSVNEQLEPLYSCVSTLNVTLMQYLRERQRGEKSKMTPEKWKEMDSIVFGFSKDPEENAFTGKIQQAVSRIESFIKPHLRI